MSIKIFILICLIILSFSLKETIYTYKAMTELKPALVKDACKYVNKDEGVIYMKPCDKGYHCWNEENGISICIPNNLLKKYGEKCNYDDECLVGHCEKNKCSFSENDKAFYVKNEGLYRCGNDLFVIKDESEDKNTCRSEAKFDYLENYCTYTKNNENSKEVKTEPIKPFYMCGEYGEATKDMTNLKLDTPFIKINKIGELKNGVKSVHEYTCETGFRSISGEDLICDNVEKLIRSGIDENGLAFAEYQFEKAGIQYITEELYDAGFFYRNYFTGQLEPFAEKYIEAFKKYVSVLKANERKCAAKSHDYYFNPLHCGIKEVYDAYFYLNHMCLYQNNTKEAKMIVEFLKNQEFQEVASSSILKKTIIGLLTILILF